MANYNGHPYYIMGHATSSQGYNPNANAQMKMDQAEIAQMKLSIADLSTDLVALKGNTNIEIESLRVQLIQLRETITQELGYLHQELMNCRAQLAEQKSIITRMELDPIILRRKPVPKLKTAARNPIPSTSAQPPQWPAGWNSTSIPGAITQQQPIPVPRPMTQQLIPGHLNPPPRAMTQQAVAGNLNPAPSSSSETLYVGTSAGTSQSPLRSQPLELPSP